MTRAGGGNPSRFADPAAVADAIIARVGKDIELALPLGPGPEQEWGKGDTATVTPLISGHPISATFSTPGIAAKRFSTCSQSTGD